MINKAQPTKKKPTHRKIASSSEVSPLIDDLRRDWELCDKVQRGDRLRDLDRQGRSVRRLARDLDIPETTLRRYVTLSLLPETDRKALKAGDTAKKALARKAVRDHARAGQQRFDAEKRSRAPSDKSAGTIVDFCKNGVPDEPIRDCDLPLLLEDVRRFARGELGPPPPVIPLLPKKISLPGLYRITRPPKSTDEDWLGHRVIWLAKIMMAVAPEPGIRETAMNKAEKRAGELEVNPTRKEEEESGSSGGWLSNMVFYQRKKAESRSRQCPWLGIDLYGCSMELPRPCETSRAPTPRARLVPNQNAPSAKSYVPRHQCLRRKACAIP